MKIDRNLISEIDLFEKSIDIVEFASNSKIDLQIVKGENWCTFQGIDKKDSKKLYTISLSSSRKTAIPIYTALIHELGHILYETPFTPIKKLLKSKKSQLPKTITSSPISAEQKPKISSEQLYHKVFNVLEDQRIESQISKSYLGHKKRFEKTRYNLGKAGFGEFADFENPVFALLAIRFMRDDIVKNTKYYQIYKKALEDVEETDRFGALRVLISIKKYIDEYLSNLESSQKPNSTGFPDSPSTLDDKHLKDMVQLSQELEEKREQLLHGNLPPTIRHKSPDFPIPPELQKSNFSEDEIKEIIQDGKKQGEEQFQNIQNKLTSRPRLDNTLSNVKKILRPSCNYEIDRKIAKGMNKVFKLLKLRSKSFIDISGTQINVDEYIENISKGTNLNRCYENSKSAHGASIVISIDASLSMHDEKIITARNLVATLFESIKGIPNMELRGNIWSSHGSGLIGITEINNIKDVKQISVRRNYNLTPLHMGLEYSMKMLKEMRGTNKLLILITDGQPNYYKNYNLVPDNIYNNQCKRSLQKVLKITPNVICFLVGKEDNNIKKIMTDIFTSKRFIIVPTMKKASQNTIEKFRHFVIKNVQNGV
ncbi:VWA domain-containing protein [Candidatus Nitrosopelagicus sp.]|nr:VWA domain-containing protein [Candidatus Nitrosopelagicus sp.]